MRFNQENTSVELDGPEAGTLLLAHPSLGDPNFRRTVIFLAAHDSADGSLGLIMNRPLGKTLGETDAEYADSELAELQLYEGGPVARDKLVLAAWNWSEESCTFQLYFGIDRSRAKQLLAEDSGFEVRAFMGHAGWSEGQLEEEMGQGAWVLSRCLPELMKPKGEDAWRSILLLENPTMRLLMDAPDDPSLN